MTNLEIFHKKGQNDDNFGPDVPFNCNLGLNYNGMESMFPLLISPTSRASKRRGFRVRSSFESLMMSEKMDLIDPDCVLIVVLVACFASKIVDSVPYTQSVKPPTWLKALIYCLRLSFKQAYMI